MARRLKVSIRLKLGLLAGIPMVGALLLALQVIGGTREQARKAEALGSIDSLAELSVQMTHVVHALQLERATGGLLLGLRTRAASPVSTTPPTEDLLVEANRDLPLRSVDTDRALDELNAFLKTRDVSRLPERLAGPLLEAEGHLKGLAALRGNVQSGQANIDEVFELHRVATQGFVRAIAGLTDLSDDGDLLRSMNSLVSLLQLEERISREHALLSAVFAQGNFPPGSYRDLVSLISEQDIYADVFRTGAAALHQGSYDRVSEMAATKRLLEMRRAALDATADDVTQNPSEWFELSKQRLSGLAGIESRLNGEVRSAALGKFRATQRAYTVSLALVAGVVLFSLVFAGLLAAGLTRRVDSLRDASRRIAEGDLSVRVANTGADELGQLGAAFNDMTADLLRARAALSDQARMARELEIAAQIQRALLPPSPAHADFEFAGRMLPADEVGGDFYDVLSRPGDDALWISIGDVSGHGVGAGLVMLMAQAAFASHFLSDAKAVPARVLAAVNALLCENITNRLRDNKYVTAQLLTYAGSGKFVCVGAHEWPIVYRRATGRCETIEAPGPWLGISSDLSDIPVTHVDLSPGDVLCLYSDGVTEAQDANGEQFDLGRLCAVLERQLAQGGALDDVTRAVFDAVETHSGQHEDDWTLLLAKRR